MALAAEKTGPAPQPPSFPEQQLQVALITPLIHVKGYDARAERPAAGRVVAGHAAKRMGRAAAARKPPRLGIRAELASDAAIASSPHWATVGRGRTPFQSLRQDCTGKKRPVDPGQGVEAGCAYNAHVGSAGCFRQSRRA